MITGRRRVDQSLTGLQVFPRLQHEHLFRPASPQSWRWYVEILLLHSSRLNLLSTQSQRRHTNARVFCAACLPNLTSLVFTLNNAAPSTFCYCVPCCGTVAAGCPPLSINMSLAWCSAANPPLLRSSSGTDGRTPDRFIDPSPHTMRAASKRVLSECLIEHGPTNYSTFRATCDICSSSSHIENWRHD